MLEMAIILTEYDPMYEEIAFKFVQHFMWIAYAMDPRGQHPDDMWDEQEGFFYDLRRLPDGQTMRPRPRHGSRRHSPHRRALTKYCRTGK